VTESSTVDDVALICAAAVALPTTRTCLIAVDRQDAPRSYDARPSCQPAVTPVPTSSVQPLVVIMGF